MTARKLFHAAGSALGRALGTTPPRMQVGALCRDRATGRVLLITSRGTGRWIIPKGWPMPGRTLADAALQEAWEEAGVRGVPDPAETGRFCYDKAQDQGFAIPIEVRVHTVWVDDLKEEFPEQGQRTREWFPPAEAANHVAEPQLQALLRQLGDAGNDPAGGTAGSGAVGATGEDAAREPESSAPPSDDAAGGPALSAQAVGHADAGAHGGRAPSLPDLIMDQLPLGAPARTGR